MITKFLTRLYQFLKKVAKKKTKKKKTKLVKVSRKKIKTSPPHYHESDSEDEAPSTLSEIARHYKITTFLDHKNIYRITASPTEEGTRLQDPNGINFLNNLLKSFGESKPSNKLHIRKAYATVENPSTDLVNWLFKNTTDRKIGEPPALASLAKNKNLIALTEDYEKPSGSASSTETSNLADQAPKMNSSTTPIIK